MRFQLLILISFFMLCAFTTQLASKYKGVSWNEKSRLWQAEFQSNGKTIKSYFNNEFNAAKKLNKLCNEMGIRLQNPEICEILNQQKKEKTSNYKGVTWNSQKGKWHVLIYLKGQKQKYGGSFNDELDAAKRVNQFCEELGIPPQNPEISTIPNEQYQKREQISQFKGVFWNKGRKKWCVLLSFKGQKQKYGGLFKDELDAAKRVNQLCEEFGIPLQNPAINAIPNQQYQKQEKTSLYKGVYWQREIKKWHVQLSLKGKKTKYGGTFNNEKDAAERANQLCEELGIPLQNPEISVIPNQQHQVTKKFVLSSQYKGVDWNKNSRKWCARLSSKGKKQKYGGMFNDELDAAKKVNQLCEELGIPLKNPEISAMPNQQYQQKENISQYKGVTWNREKRKWYVHMYLTGGKKKYGGQFKDELDAAKRVNQLCEELTIPLKNPEISAIPNQQYSHDYQTIENSVISSEILKSDNNHAKGTKRKRRKEFNDDNKLPYFYENLLN